MPENNLPLWENIHTIVFDFDGVFTNNKVWVDENGKESVRCDRSDGLAFDLLRAFSIEHDWDIDYFILSKESNKVVSQRANKLKIRCHHNIANKYIFLKEHITTRFPNKDHAHRGLIYLGNDLNDLQAMLWAGFSVAPSDSHPLIIKNADLVLKQNGGDGFVRSFIEKLIRLNEIDIMKLNL